MFDREDSMSECVLSPDLCWAEGWPCWGFGWSALSGHGSPSCWCSQKPPVLVVGEMGCTGMQTWNQNTHTHTQIHHWFLILRLVPRRKALILLKIQNISNVQYLHNFVIYDYTSTQYPQKLMSRKIWYQIVPTWGLEYNLRWHKIEMWVEMFKFNRFI